MKEGWKQMICNENRHETKALLSSIHSQYFTILTAWHIPMDSQLDRKTDFTFDFSELQSTIKKRSWIH